MIYIVKKTTNRSRYQKQEKVPERLMLAQILFEWELMTQTRTQGRCRGCIPPTRLNEMLTRHLISLKIIAKIFLYCTLL